MISLRTLLTLFSRDRSSSRTMVLSTITIKFTCPHCLGVHIHDFPLSWLTSTRTFHQSTIPCSNDSSKGVLLELETLIKTYTASVVLKLEE